jgi:hypothetical protein
MSSGLYDSVVFKAGAKNRTYKRATQEKFNSSTKAGLNKKIQLL